jgi:hypothetical protein
MALATNKRVNDYTSNRDTEKFLSALSAIAEIPVTQLLYTIKGSGTDIGTWAHPKVAVHFAQWSNPEFAVQVSYWVEELMMKGYVAIADKPEINPLDRAARFAEALVTFKSFGVDLDNPRFSAGIKDLILDSLGVSDSRLTSTETIKCGVAERAEQLGYAPNIVAQYRSSLGKFVKANGLIPLTEEKRLCNGTERPINLYEVSDELDNAIECYFNKKLGV